MPRKKRDPDDLPSNGMTMDDLPEGQKDAKGRFQKGNQMAKLATGRKRVPRHIREMEKNLKEEAREMAISMLENSLPAAMLELEDRMASGDMNAVKVAFQYGIGSRKPETKVPKNILEKYSHLHPENRIEAYNREAAAGNLSLEALKMLNDGAQQEIQMGVVAKIRNIAKKIDKGLDPLSAVKLLAEIGDELDDGLLIEGD